MKNKNNLQRGFIGIISLLIAVAIIIFFIVRTDLFGSKDGKNVIEQGQSDIQSAKDTKALLESESAKQAEEMNQ